MGARICEKAFLLVLLRIPSRGHRRTRTQRNPDPYCDADSYVAERDAKGYTDSCTECKAYPNEVQSWLTLFFLLPEPEPMLKGHTRLLATALASCAQALPQVHSYRTPESCRIHPLKGAAGNQPTSGRYPDLAKVHRSP